MAYSEKVVDHFNNPRNMGSFRKDEPGVGTGIVGAPECGDVMKLQIKVEDGTIVDAKFKTFGCGSAIASSSLSTEVAEGEDDPGGGQDQEYGHCTRTESAARQDPLLGLGRECDQNGIGGL